MLKAIPVISKKFMIVLIGVMLVASMILFISPGKIYPDSAAFNFVEYAKNPLFGGATSGVDCAYQPYVIKIGGIYNMWYGDGVNARYISSAYPDFNDAKKPGTIVSVSGTTSIQPYKFTVYYNPDGWTLKETHYSQKLVAYYTDGLGVGIWRANPKVAVSDDGINWTFVAQTTGVLEYSTVHSNSSDLYRLSVLYEGNNVWKGYADSGGAIILYYTSPNGIDWTGGVATDLLSWYTPSLLQPWERGKGAISPYVFKMDNTYVMTYSAGETNNNQAIGIAYSENGINFTKSSTNPIFSVDNKVAWRTDRTYNSYIMFDDGLWRMYFQGNAAGNYSVGMATSAIPVTSITQAPATTTVSSGDIAGLISSGIFLADSPIDAPKITVKQQATINVPFGSGTSSVTLPAGTEITNAAGGNINPSALAAVGVTPSSLSGLGTGIVVDGAFQWGIAGLGLQFSQPIKITIYVGTALASQTLTILRSISETSDWTSDGIVPPATAVVDAAGYVTFQATKASYYAATHTAAAVVEPQPSAPSKPLTPEERVSLNLSIAEQVSLYGASNTGFTKMLYDNILGRVTDAGGLNDWVTALNNGMITLGDVVYNFVFSKELEPMISSFSNEEFITFLYENVLDRDADPDGYAGWVSAMNSGMSKEEVLLHFIDSDEFGSICEMFGLTP